VHPAIHDVVRELSHGVELPAASVEDGEAVEV
jgi:hypothetical protein